MAGFSGFGTKFQRGDGASPEVFATIGEATNISGPALERDTIDVTSHDSTNGFREWVGGLKDGGEVSFEVNYDPSIHNVLYDDLNDTQPRNYKVILPDGVDGDGAEWAFQAFLTGVGQEYPMDDKLTNEFTFKVSGEPTYTAGS